LALSKNLESKPLRFKIEGFGFGLLSKNLELGGGWVVVWCWWLALFNSIVSQSPSL